MKKIFMLTATFAGCGDNIVPEEEPIDLTGPSGPQGPQGPVGSTGAQGETGLTGATGPQGPQGEQGLPGEDGLDGLDGLSGLDGATGAQGPIGPAGPPGLQGAPGLQGLTGPAGTDGTSTVSAGNLVAGDASRPSVTFTVPAGTTMNAWLHFNVVGGGTNEVFDTWDGVAQGSCAKGTNQVSCDRVKLLSAGTHTISVTNSGTVDRATLIVLGL